jgi:8-oxo-dGTP pyrophosphatase MutT (NUDIX family)
MANQENENRSKKLEKHFTASALIFHKEKVLLVKHRKLGVWLYPGGHTEPNETPEETLLREVKEETGLTVKIIGEKDEELSDLEHDVKSLSLPYAILLEKINGKNDPHYHIDLIYRCKIEDSSLKDTHFNESSEIKWFTKEELQGNSKLFPNFRRLLEKVFSAENLQ